MTEEFFVEVTPQNTLDPELDVVVSAGERNCSARDQEIFPEDTQLNLSVDLKHSGENNDSNAWYYSHLEVTDNKCVAGTSQDAYIVPYYLHLSDHDGHMAHREVVYEPLGSGFAVDFTPQEAGIGAYPSGGCTQRSYANNLTRALTVEKVAFHDFPNEYINGCDTKKECLKSAQSANI